MTTFTAGPGVQTLPMWIFDNLFRPNQAPVVNVVAAVLIVLSVLPVWLAAARGGRERRRPALGARGGRLQPDFVPVAGERGADGAGFADSGSTKWVGEGRGGPVSCPA